MALRKDLILVGLLVAILMLMIVPLQQVVIDVLLSLNITLAIVLLMVAIYLKQPSDFSTFPSVILIGTAFRLALSIATTRLILSEADGGQIIETFGEFVVSGSVAIGLVIFLIITVVQFLVVTKGAERVAEVGARFALDALPGKQMSIDADIRAGTLDPTLGEQMRRQLDRNSQFFGSMDGAMKFVKGDAIAGLIIIVINLVGGIAVGVTTHSLSFGEAGAVFSLLTIGDGLVAQVPALLMSLCAGIIVTRATNIDNADLGTDIGRELLVEPRVPGVAAAIVFSIGLVPGFPLPVFGAAAAALAIFALLIAARLRREAAEAGSDARPEPDNEVEAFAADVGASEDVLAFPVSDRLVLGLGLALAERIDVAEMSARLEARVIAFNERRGVTFARPAIVIAPQLGDWGLQIEFDDVPVIRETLSADLRLFRIEAEDLREVGIADEDWREFTWPTFRGIGVTGNAVERFVSEEAAELHMSFGDVVGDLVFHSFECRVSQLFTRREFDAVIADCEVQDLAATQRVTSALGAACLMATMRSLIEDGVPLRPIGVVTEALQRWVEERGISDPMELADALRLSLRRQLCHAAIGEDGLLGLVLLDPDVEALFQRRIGRRSEFDGVSLAQSLHTASDKLEALLSELRRIIRDSGKRSRHLAIVASSDLRRKLRQFLAINDIHVIVLAPHEIADDVRTIPLSVLRIP
ncbi:FHIPEP family type III secretion protein [Sulfitobacter sp. 20_GPM-1509m]|uniref:FHIPEP family type III secretion protein n=1 Tax=Sulfitobacter sp. 20_GPM-1509m TaxID=1380367 RepID=UPI000688937E|nr:FHIPEP family type III secretion protein [Sulfitobacter sp. 20_GPM-1509m]